MASGCITGPFVSQQHGVTGKLRFCCLHWRDQWLTNTVHSFMVREGCNGLTVARLTFHERLPGVLSRHVPTSTSALCGESVYSIYVCMQPNNSNQYFSLSSTSVEIISKQAILHPGVSKDEMWSNGQFTSHWANTPFLFHLATRRHSTAWNRYGDHEEETEEQLKPISANFLLLYLLKGYYSKLHPRFLFPPLWHNFPHTNTHEVTILTSHTTYISGRVERGISMSWTRVIGLVSPTSKIIEKKVGFLCPERGNVKGKGA